MSKISYDFNENAMMVVSGNNKLSIGFDGDDFIIKFGNVSVVYERDHLAEMLWGAAYLVDSEQRYTEDEYVGINYEIEDKENRLEVKDDRTWEDKDIKES